MDGELTRKAPKAGGVGWQFFHSFHAVENNKRLNLAQASDGKEIGFFYDPFQRLVARRWGSPRGADELYFDGPDIALERRAPTGLGVQWLRYVHGPGADQPLAMEVYPLNATPAPGTGSKFYYHADGEGSIRLLTDANGQIANRYDYDSFGRRLSVTESVPNQPYGWKGREWIAGPDIYYNRARFYDPVLGRFMPQDPLGYGGGDFNLYSFAWNNPKKWNDPSGLVALDYGSLARNGAVTGAATGAIAAGVNCALNAASSALSHAIDAEEVTVGLCAVAVVKGAAEGAFVGAASGIAFARVLSTLPNPIKGKIGEALSGIYNRLKGSRIDPNYAGGNIPGLRTIPDWVLLDTSGIVYFVESKFGKSALTAAQKEALRQLGPVAYRVERWSYNFFAGVGGGVGGAGVGGSQ